MKRFILKIRNHYFPEAATAGSASARSERARFAISFAVLSLPLLLCACVSVNIGPKPAQTSAGVAFQPPQTPFQSLRQTSADGAWQNKTNGNTISYLSSCRDPVDPPLETVLRELFAELRDLKLVSSINRSFNGREAIESEVEGKLDGITTRIRALVFKRNDCLYTLTYIALPLSYQQDLDQFHRFLESFQAP